MYPIVEIFIAFIAVYLLLAVRWLIEVREVLSDHPLLRSGLSFLVLTVTCGMLYEDVGLLRRLIDGGYTLQWPASIVFWLIGGWLGHALLVQHIVRRRSDGKPVAKWVEVLAWYAVPIQRERHAAPSSNTVQSLLSRIEQERRRRTQHGAYTGGDNKPEENDNA